MTFFRRKLKNAVNANVKVNEVYVVTSKIISSYNDETGYGPMCVNMYFLAKCKDGEYYELFSGRKLENKKQPEDGFLLQTFDTPYVKESEPLSNYWKNSNQVTIDIQSLFDFITNMNVLDKLDCIQK